MPGSLRLRHSSALAGLFLSAPCWTSIAAAQTSQVAHSQGLAEIVVTAERRSENLQRTPIAITAITGDAIETRRITDATDVNAVPLFVRIGTAARMTTTFKLEKHVLQREGYAPDGVAPDRLYVVDQAAGTYVPLTPESLKRAGLPPFEPED